MQLVNKSTINKLKELKRGLKKYPIIYSKVSDVCMYIRKLKARRRGLKYKCYREQDQVEALMRGMQYSREQCLEVLKELKSKQRKHIAFLITEYEEINNTGDKYSAISLGEQLKLVEPGVLISYYVRDPRMEWANVSCDVDYIIVMDPDTDFRLIDSLSAKKIAWVRGNYNSWMKKNIINKYNEIIVSSSILKDKFIMVGLESKVKAVINLGIPIDVQKKLENNSIQTGERELDVVFIGNLYDVERDIVRYLEPEENYRFNFYGNIKDSQHKWQKYNCGKLNHKEITSIYLNTKIVIEDIAPFNEGTVNLRVFEAAACGCLVISNYDQALVELFGDKIEMYKTKQELNEKIRYYLENETARKCKAMELQELVKCKYTFRNEAVRLLEALY